MSYTKYTPGLCKCKTCGLSKPSTEFGTGPSGRIRHCNDCYSMRECRTCLRRKPLGDFADADNKHTGKSRVCLECFGKGKPARAIANGILVCRSCKQAKPQSEFRRDGSHRTTFYAARCLACTASRKQEAEERRIGLERSAVSGKVCSKCLKHKPIERFMVQRSRPDGRMSACADCFKTRRTKLEASTFKHRQNIYLFHRYGITSDEFDQMVASQGGLCGICSSVLHFDSTSRGCANVDHDHVTGKVRMVLCHPCNSRLGIIENYPEFTKKALAYLKAHGVDVLGE